MEKYDNNEFDKKLANVMKDYKRIGNYIDNHTKIKFLHETCGREFEARPSNILQGYGCPHCKKKTFKGQEGFEKQVYDLVGDEYTVLGEYKSYHSKVKMRHNICGHEWEVKAGNFTSIGRRCPNCAGTIKKDEKFVQETLNKIVPNEYTVIGKYKNNSTPIKIRHNSCDNVFEATLKNIQKGRFSCPHCRMSSGEIIVSRILESFNVDYEYQYKNDFCKDKHCLPFDFKIEINDNIYIIEYDGRQHFLPIFGYNDEERKIELEKTIHHDKIKNDFCKENNYNLLRIKYDKTKEQIAEEIKNFLNL